MEYAAKVHRRIPRRAVCVTEVLSITFRTSGYPQRFPRAHRRGKKKPAGRARVDPECPRTMPHLPAPHPSREWPVPQVSPSPRNVLDSENRCFTFHGETTMSKPRSIAVLLVAAAYWTAAYGNSLWFMVPSVGSGVPAVQRAAEQKREAPRPCWTPRRHLPLVKFLSFEHFPRNAGERTSDGYRPGSRLLPPVSPVSEDHPDSPSPSRAPPVS
jgi:hypothetical protein